MIRFRYAFLTAFACAALAVVAFMGEASPGQVPSVSAAGCAPGKPHASGSSVQNIVSSGVTREYILHVPPSYNGADRVPVILSFHGLGSNHDAQELYSGLSTLADDADGGFIAAYPQGTALGNGTRFWNTTQPGSPYDVVFVSDMIDRFESELCIDAERVYSSGMSNGAQMSVRLACSLSSRIAAIAPVAGAYYPPAFTGATETCEDTRAVPVISFHGTADSTIPYNGGPGILGLNFRLPIDNATVDEDVTEDWALHNGCTSGRQESTVSAEVRFILYDACVDGADSQHYAVDGGGHTWPGSFDVPSLGYTTHDISATDLMWAFFQAHPMPGAPGPQDFDGDTVPDADDDDNDNDTCPDASEAGLSALAGGLRNSKNPWDYFNPTGDGQNRIDDVLAVLDQYFEDEFLPSPPNPPSTPNPDYTASTDRTFVGPQPWDLGPPNGQQRVDDILAALDQYFHDCE